MNDKPCAVDYPALIELLYLMMGGLSVSDSL